MVEWLVGGGYDGGMRCRGLRAAHAGLCLLAAGCGDRESAARNDLGQAGYALTGAELFRAAAADDTAALARFADAGMDLAARDAAGDTALHVAAAAGAGRAARFLLDRKLPLDAAGAGRRTPLHAAAAAGRAEMAAWLLRQGADPAKRDGEGYKPLLRAVEAGRTGVVETMAPFVRDDLDTALLLAALLGKPEMIDVLTDFGASVYARTDDGRTALMVAAANGHLGTVNMLMALGANRFAVDADGMTAAELAAAAGHDDVAAALSGEVAAEEFGLEPPEELAAVPQPAPPDADTPAAGDRPAAAAVAAGNDVPAAGAGAALADGGPPPPLAGATLAAADGAGHGGEPVAAGDDGSPGGPADSSAGGAGVVPEPAGGSALDRPAPGPPGAPRLAMRSYREEVLPVRVEGVAPGRARLRLLAGQPRVVELAEGEAVPGSRLRVVRIERRLKGGKLRDGEPVDVSLVEVEDGRSGRRRVWTTGLAATAGEPVALVEDEAGGTVYQAHAGDRFTVPAQGDYAVREVRPGQLVVEHLASGETFTLALRGPRG